MVNTSIKQNNSDLDAIEFHRIKPPRIEYVLLNKIINIIKPIIHDKFGNERKCFVINILGPRTVGKSYIVKDCINMLINFPRLKENENIGDKAKNLVEVLFKNISIIPIIHDCSVNCNFDLNVLQNYISSYTLDLREPTVFIIAVDEAIMCKEEKLLDVLKACRFLSPNFIFLLVNRSGLKFSKNILSGSVQDLLYLPHRFVEIAEYALQEIKDYMTNKNMLSGKNRYKILTENDGETLLNTLDDLSEFIINNNLVYKLKFLYMLYLIFGGTLGGLRRCISIYNKVKNNLEEIDEELILKNIGHLSYINFLRIFWEKIEKDAIISGINIQLLYLYLSYVVKKTFFDNDININEGDIYKFIENNLTVFHYIPIGRHKQEDLRKHIHQVGIFTEHAYILFYIKGLDRLQSYENCIEENYEITCDTTYKRIVFVDNRFALSALFEYLKYFGPEDRSRENKLREIILSIVKTMIGDKLQFQRSINRINLGGYIESAVLKDLVLGMYSIIASKDKPIMEDKPDKLVKTCQIIKIKKNTESENKKDKKKIGDADAILLFDGKPYYGIDISISNIDEDQSKLKKYIRTKINFNLTLIPDKKIFRKINNYTYSIPAYVFLLLF